MNLYRLVYSSQASLELSPENLQEISTVSQKNPAFRRLTQGTR